LGDAAWKEMTTPEIHSCCFCSWGSTRTRIFREFGPRLTDAQKSLYLRLREQVVSATRRGDKRGVIHQAH
jgi:hypothetical protein